MPELTFLFSLQWILWPDVHFAERITSWLDSPYITLNTDFPEFEVIRCRIAQQITGFAPTNIQSMPGSQGH